MSTTMHVRRLCAMSFTIVAALLAWGTPALAQREMPDDPTPSVSTDPNAPKVKVKSTDFERIDDIHVALDADGKHLTCSIAVKLLGAASDYDLPLRLKLWADFDEDRELTDAELLLDETRFAADAHDGVLAFSGVATLAPGQVFNPNTLLRAVLCYGDTPRPAGDFRYGDVVDQSPPVQVIQPSAPPVVAPGYPRTGGPVRIVESAPGKATGELVLVSPKGTAISLTRTRIKRISGDIKIGPAWRDGRTLHIPISGASTVASEIRITPVLAIDDDFVGPVVLETNLHDQTATVAVVELPPSLAHEGGVTIHVPGTAKSVGTLVVTEGAGGQLSGELVLVSPKGTAISLTNTRVRAPKGDIGLGKPYLDGTRRLVIPIAKESTLASEVEVDLVLDIKSSAPAVIVIEVEPDTIVPRFAIVAFVWKWGGLFD